MTERVTYFADVILPLHLPQCYTYRVPFEYNEDIKVGQRVAVQFGAKRVYSAIVRRIHRQAPDYRTVKYISAILDSQPIVTETQLEFWEWIAGYYMCYTGDVMAVALPSAYRLESESVVLVHPDFSGELENLSENEIKILEVLSRENAIAVSEVSKIIDTQKIMPVIKTMIEKKIIILEEEIRQRYTPKTETYLMLNPVYLDPEKGKELFDTLEKKPSAQKQLNVLLAFLKASRLGHEPVQKKVFTKDKNLSLSAMNTLIKHGVLTSYDKQVSRLADFEEITSADTIKLTGQQQDAFDKIDISNPGSHDTTLVYGVTSSGKTELYIKLMNEVVKQGKQVLYLLPEIALTAQIINRLRKYFGTKVGVYHSKFTPNERAEVWKKTISDDKEDRYQILLGARSAMFLPFRDLGLVIIDEEHDSSYKQYEPAPRYNARDSAIYLARLCNAKAVLGTATPSIETFYNAKNGKYALVEMPLRYGETELPEIEIVDMKKEPDAAKSQSHFSKKLLSAIGEALENHEQVILFQNRRGFSLHVECHTCKWIPECKNCDVSLVYHKQTGTLRCHYCGYSVPVPHECPECHSTYLEMKGFGTERIEDELSILFPEAHIARLDLDTTSGKKNRYADIISDFEERNIDILVGTQMVTKGLDFDNVSVVGIMSADNMLSFPDFRAFERSFQQMTQVSGRAGRRGRRGKVLIQTYRPEHRVLRNVMENDFLSMYESQITERNAFKYPPYHKLIYIIMKHPEADVLDKASDELSARLRLFLGNRVVGPEYPMVSRVRNLFVKNIMIRLERNVALAAVKQKIMALIEETLQKKEYGRLRILPDVDPQ